MTYQTAPLAYRRAATQHASVVGLVIALCDTLIGNLQRAAHCIDRGDVQSRCDELTHGFKVLTQLDAMLDMKNGGPTAAKLRYFYNHLRRQMLAAQFTLDSNLLFAQVKAVLEVREAWQQIDQATGAPDATPVSHPSEDEGVAPAPQHGEAVSSFSCSG